jgi:hypothetical protein
MKAIIVGNAASLLNRNNGYIINSYDIVIRLNKFKIKGFEKHVGIKTDIYCSKWLNMSYNLENVNSFKEIWLPYPKPPSWWTSSGNFNEVDTETHNNYINKFNIHEKVIKYMPEECLSEFEEVFKKTCQPSTGLIAILMAIKYLKNYTINYTGFDAFSTGWYWEPSHNCLKNMKNSILFETIFMNYIYNKYGVKKIQ